MATANDREGRPDVTPGHVPTEENVPADEREVPTARPTVRLLAWSAAALGTVGLLLAIFDLEIVGAVLAALGLVAALVGSAMASGDARADAIFPSVMAFGCLMVGAVALFLAFGDDLADDDGLGAPGGALVAPATVDPAQIPEDPADIVEGTEAQRELR